MTDHPDDPLEPLDPRDELASADLDGLTTPEEAARIAADPEVQARLAAMGAARAALRGDVPVDGTRRDQAIAAALADFDLAAGIGGTTDELTARRRRRAPGRALPLVGLVAAVALLALLLPRLGDHHRTDTVASRAADSAAGKSAPEVASGLSTTTAMPSDRYATSEDLGTGGAATSSPAITEADLGAVPDLTALAKAAGQRLDQPAPTEPSQSLPAHDAALDPCFADLTRRATEAGDTVVLQAAAQVHGAPVAAVVEADPQGHRLLRAEAVDGCRALGTAPVTS